VKKPPDGFYAGLSAGVSVGVLFALLVLALAAYGWPEESTNCDAGAVGTPQRDVP
jgi:hypothetical protein